MIKIIINYNLKKYDKFNSFKLAPLHIYHKPMWLPSIVRNSPEEFKALNDLEKINQKIDEEIKVFLFFK